jgi:hypothetical protein
MLYYYIQLYNYTIFNLLIIFKYYNIIFGFIDWD